MREDNSDVARVSNSTELADWAMQWLITETPDFVAVHNGFKFDVSRLAAHCLRHYWHYFRETNLGKSNRGHDLAIPGVTMIDTYYFLSKLHNVEYESFALDNLASVIGEEGKKQHPDDQI
jgi:DNA polymerase elongation subunit (family B)